ncbi:MAG TPA: hypothetical protein VMM77_02715 [Gemmatimonadaceae bacterium]|nr:hypothetical protein [Gemmatimonadaceae bacterium]
MRLSALIVAALAIGACAKASTSTASGTISANAARSVPNARDATLRVDNQAFPDMAIYVVESSGMRSRIGTATGNSVTTLRIPGSLLGGVRSLRFQADPIGGSRAPISEEITLVPGEVITLTIPPTE